MIEKNIQQALKYKPGDVVTLKVARIGEMGAFLDAGTGNTSDDILLHKLQQTEEVKEGDKVKVYLYLDPNKRLTASMKLPKMREGQLGYVKVCCSLCNKISSLVLPVPASRNAPISPTRATFKVTTSPGLYFKACCVFFSIILHSPQKLQREHLPTIVLSCRSHVLLPRRCALQRHRNPSKSNVRQNNLLYV